MRSAGSSPTRSSARANPSTRNSNRSRAHRDGAVRWRWWRISQPITASAAMATKARVPCSIGRPNVSRATRSDRSQARTACDRGQRCQCGMQVTSRSFLAHARVGGLWLELAAVQPRRTTESAELTEKQRNQCSRIRTDRCDLPKRGRRRYGVTPCGRPASG